MRFGSNIEESGDRWSLVVGPLVFQHSVVEFGIVIGPTADVDNQIGVWMVLVEVLSHIVNGVAYLFFQEIGSRVGHGDDTVCNVGEI